jgi:cytidylate kinase
MSSIALYGRSGSGKSTVAALFAERGYHHVRTGVACRKICNELFGSTAKSLMNEVTDALRSVDPAVWLRAALRDMAVGDRVVFDSMRFEEDYNYLRGQGFVLVEVTASLAVRERRLADRGQVFDPLVDDLHLAETALADMGYAMVLDNDGTEADLRRQVDRLLDLVDPRRDR